MFFHDSSPADASGYDLYYSANVYVHEAPPSHNLLTRFMHFRVNCWHLLMAELEKEVNRRIDAVINGR